MAHGLTPGEPRVLDRQAGVSAVTFERVARNSARD
jgi:hypothetical protein